MPLFLSRFVPVGLMGLLLAAMLAADMSSTSSYMITWGSVIYNDILAPFRKTPWSEKRGLLWNRVIVSLIGVFLLFYGLWYPLKGDVYAYLLVTGTIYLASISTMLIACCYWKRANNWGAAAAIIVGAVIPIACLVIEQVRNMHPDDVQLWRCYSGIAAFLATGGRDDRRVAPEAQAGETRRGEITDHRRRGIVISGLPVRHEGASPSPWLRRRPYPRPLALPAGDACATCAVAF